MTPAADLTIRPIGHIRTIGQAKFTAPHQPDRANEGVRGVIELLPHHNFELALRDLGGFDWIWLVWWFHRNSTWRPMVLPPRGPQKRRGVFATRSPHRPNPIGLTAVPLLGIEKGSVLIGAHDLVDGTPIIDIKPYLPRVDAVPDAKSGWVDEIEVSTNADLRYQVRCTREVEEQLSWLAHSWQIDFFTRARDILQRDPSPHRTRRITRSGPGFRMGCGAWRIYFSVTDHQVLVHRVTAGYPDRLLQTYDGSTVPDHEAQVAFNLRFQRDT